MTQKNTHMNDDGFGVSARRPWGPQNRFSFAFDFLFEHFNSFFKLRKTQIL